MLTTKKRLLLLICGMLVLIIPAIINQLLIIANSSLNPTDINLYQEETTILYEYTDGDEDKKTRDFEMEIKADPDKDTEVEAKLDKTDFEFEVDYDSGQWINGSTGKKTDYYTLWWVKVQNPMLHLWDIEEGEEFEVVDPIGIINGTTEVYKLIIREKKVYWDVKPGMDGAQFSYIFELYNKNEKKVADGLMDSTCGFLEVLENGLDGSKLEIVDPGSFLVSRNRDQMLLWGIVIGIALPIIAYVLMVKKFNIDKEEAEEFALLVACAAIVVIVDIDIDVWFYAWLGEDGWYLLHFACLAFFAMVCLKLRYGVKWSFPAFLEIAFVFAMTTFVGDPFVPHATAFMGLYASYLAMLFRSGLEKRGYDKRLDIIV